MHVWKNVCTRVFVCLCVFVFVHVCLFVFVCVCLCLLCTSYKRCGIWTLNPKPYPCHVFYYVFVSFTLFLMWFASVLLHCAVFYLCFLLCFIVFYYVLLCFIVFYSCAVFCPRAKKDPHSLSKPLPKESLLVAVIIYGRNLLISSQLMWGQPHLAALCMCLPFPFENSTAP